MAVYAVSLRGLRRCAARRARVEEPPQAAAGREQAQETAATGGAGASPLGVPPQAPGNVAFAASVCVDDLLKLPASRIEALLAECGEPGGKALLVLVHRLACVEAQLAELQAEIRAGSVGGSIPAPVGAHPSRKTMRDPTRHELLEQVYRKNLALRRTG